MRIVGNAAYVNPELLAKSVRKHSVWFCRVTLTKFADDLRPMLVHVTVP
jgi:hypothetical protein